MLDGHPDIRAVALDYYGTLVDVGKPFDRIRAWFAEKLHGSGVDPQTFFHRFSRERAFTQRNSGWDMSFLSKAMKPLAAGFICRRRHRCFKHIFLPYSLNLQPLLKPEKPWSSCGSVFPLRCSPTRIT